MLLVDKKLVLNYVNNLSLNVPQGLNIDLNDSFNQSGETSNNSWYFAKL